MVQFQLFAIFRVNFFGLGDYGLTAVAASAGSLAYPPGDTVLTVSGTFTLTGGSHFGNDFADAARGGEGVNNS